LFSAHYHCPTSARELVRTLNTHLIPLKDLLQVSVVYYFYYGHPSTEMRDLRQILPLELGLSIELAYPSAAMCPRIYLSRTHNLNSFVDCVLSMVYSSLTGTNQGERGGVLLLVASRRCSLPATKFLTFI
jgi:hypothetical protein